MKHFLLTTTLRLGFGFVSLLMAPPAHAQHYLVNGHPATAQEEQLLASNGFTDGAWRVDGWGIALDTTRTNFVPEPRPPVAPQCHYVLDVALDCEVKVASR